MPAVSASHLGGQPSRKGVAWAGALPDLDEDEDSDTEGFLQIRRHQTEPMPKREPVRKRLEALPAPDPFKVISIAREASMSVSDVMKVKQIFDGFDWDKTGDLDIEEFHQVVQKVRESESRGALPDELANRTGKWTWAFGDTDRFGRISFEEFLMWYTSNGFNEDMLLSAEEQKIRMVAKEFEVSLSCVDRIKRHFDMADNDGSGFINLPEFEQVIHKMLNLPKDLKLSRLRIQYFWSEIDSSGDGRVAFEEFLLWWLKYFNEEKRAPRRESGTSLGGVVPKDSWGGNGTSYIAEFYKSFRCLGSMQMDPPAYRGRSCAGDDGGDEALETVWRRGSS